MIAIIGVIIFLSLLYLYGTRNFDYWKKRGIVHDKPIPFLGNSARQLLFKISITDFFSEMYRKYPNERFVGLFAANNPVLIVREPRDVQRVLVSDFNTFYPRGTKLHEKAKDPLQDNLFGADGDLWKLLRTRMTPVFTSGKLKAMFPLIVERAEKFQQIATTRANNNEEVDMKDLISRYTMDFIGVCGFGIEMEALNDDNSVFRQLGLRVFNARAVDIARILLKTLLPSLMRNVPTFAPEVTKLTTSLVEGIMKQRNHKPTNRNDFIDQMLEVRAKGLMVGESIEKKNPDGSPLLVERELDDALITAQAFVFFLAGFETSSTTSSQTLHQFAFHPEEQKRAQEEVDEVLKKYDGKLCYEAVKEMHYLKMCFYESMRLFPSVGILNRKTANRYTFPDSDLTIEKGTAVFVCNHAMQLDEKYFENPHDFIPERFSPENAHKLPKHVFLPFGEGPRACIGERLGLMQALAGLATILQKFNVAPSKNSKRHPEPNPLSGLAQTVKGGVPVLLTLRNKTN